jgi:hypothetical protein
MQLASGEVYGKDQPLALQLLGSERSREALEGVAMELEDSLYPLLREVGGGTQGYASLHGHSCMRFLLPCITYSRRSNVMLFTELWYNRRRRTR